MTDLPQDRKSLLELRVQTLGDLSEIRSQIEEAVDAGNPDRVWLRSAKRAERLKAMEIQRIEVILSGLKAQRSSSIESAFVAAAQQILEERLFHSIMAVAQRHVPREISQGGP